MNVQWRASCRDERGAFGNTERIHFEECGVVNNRKGEVEQDGADMVGREGKAPCRSEFVPKLLGLSIQSGAGV